MLENGLFFHYNISMKRLSWELGFATFIFKDDIKKIHWSAAHYTHTQIKLTINVQLVVIVENNCNHEINDEATQHQ